MSSHMQQRVVKFLAQGLKPAQVASIIGITPARISQLAQEPGFEEALALEREQYEVSDSDAAAAALLNSKYMALESKLIDTVDANAALMEPRDLVRALDVIGQRAQRMAQRATPRLEHAGSPGLTVNINLPNHALPEYQVNAQSEIIAIDNKPMAPLPAAGVKALFAGLKAKAVELAQPSMEEPLHDF